MHHHQEAATATPILSVQDMAASLFFYRRLGLHIDPFDADYAIVSLAGHELLHLEANETRAPASMYLNVRDADSWRARWVEAGITVSAIEDRPWGMREFTVSDPSGNTVRVGNNL